MQSPGIKGGIFRVAGLTPWRVCPGVFISRLFLLFPRLSVAWQHGDASKDLFLFPGYITGWKNLHLIAHENRGTNWEESNKQERTILLTSGCKASTFFIQKLKRREKTKDTELIIIAAYSQSLTQKAQSYHFSI